MAVNWVHLVHIVCTGQQTSRMRTGPPSDSGQYKQVRGLARGLALLRALNRAPGGIATITDLAGACDMHRTTVKRLLETLRSEGLVGHSDRDGQYYLTFEVRRLSDGFADEAWLDRVAGPLMVEAVSRLSWPSDLSTPEAGFMVVRQSTQRQSALSQHRAMIGERLPMLVTAAGRAWFAACPPAQRERLLDLLRGRDDESGRLARDTGYVARMLADTRVRGYAHNDGEWAPQSAFAAIGVPIRGDGGTRRPPIAAINLVFPRDALTPKDLQARYVPGLKRLAEAIGRGARELSLQQAAATAPPGDKTATGD